MRGKLFLLLLFFVSLTAYSQTYTMQNGIFSTCTGTFYDSGGTAANYGPNENYQITFCPATPGTYIQLQFTSFNVEGEPRDFLKIYSGTGTTGPLLGTYGDFSPVGCSDGILSSDPSGCITITFVSDGSVQDTGWAATISCSPTPNTILAPTNAVCPGAKPFCADAGGSIEFPNLSSCDNVPDAPTVITNNTCLDTAPNPAWYYLSVAIPGRLELEISQTTGAGGTGAGLDVDFAIWGPFPNQSSACANFTLGDCIDDHDCSGNVIDCSYKIDPIEYAVIPNALVGEIYMVLITNYDGDAGFISMTQTNAGLPGAGATDCSIVCPVGAGTNPTCGSSNNGKITISGLTPLTLYQVSYADDGVPVASPATSNAAGQIIITGLDAGNYTNILTNYTGCTTTPSNVVLTSATPPVLTGITATTPICYGSNAVYTITGTPNAVVTYHINSGANQTVMLNATGSATVTVNAITVDTTLTTTVISLSGCNTALSDIETVVVTPLPSITLNSPVANTNQTLCINSVITPIAYTVANATNASVTGLPTGVSGTFNAGAYTLSGTPTQGGTFNYTVSTVGGCTPAVTLSGVLKVTLLPTATISYAGTPFCRSLNTLQSVTLTGTNAYTGGTFSALPAGLSISAISGNINPSASTAGTYTVTYLVPASGGCTTVTATTTVVITAVPTAIISYTGSPFCTTLTAPQNVTLTGTNAYTGGSFSATPAGLSINSLTGAFVPSGSLAGTYTISYLVPASSGCSTVTTTTTVKITALPTASISYAGTPFCKSIATSQSVALTGTDAYTGGTFSALPAGLSINASSGVINPSASTAGTYTVTYLVPASSGCAAVPVTTNLKITSVPTASISYTGSPFCKSSTTAQPVTLTGNNAYTGGSFSASPGGLSINSGTGAIVPSGTLAGTYTVTYTFPAVGGCPGNQATTSVTITNVPTASISYAGTPFCKSLTAAQSVTLIGTNAYTGGTFSALPAGLSINASSGVINPSASTAGTYTVTYLVPATGGCSTVSATATVVITAVPTATISYAGTPFCSTLTSSQTVALTGTNAYTGGVFSATPAGLSINSGTGAIVPSGSLAGTYTVTYTFPAVGGCAGNQATTSVMITNLPTANISYSGTPFCKSLTAAQSVTLIGTNAYTGGTFSALPAGLSINASSGVINPSASTAGTYAVTYLVPATGGCSTVSATATVVITAVPTAAISYAGTPFCSTLTSSQTVALTGTNAYTGGVFSATPAGLSINSGTGAIVPSGSLAGTYTVTYTFPAIGGCAGNQATTSVTITNLPTASISYVGTPFCKSLTTAQSVTLTGTNAYTGGTFSALPTGLSINASSGAINPSASTAGTYAVTYLVPASSGCSTVSATATVVITAVPTATISYAGTPFCSTLTSSQIVALTGTNAYTGGIFSATPAGLSINASSGAIVPSLSVAGTYTVTYLVAASAGCSTFSTSTNVTITTLPTATISYAGTPFCSTLTSSQAVTLTGTNAYTGGAFSATPAGLSISASTGNIVPSGSLAGNYTVTYLAPSNGGCPSVPATTTVRVADLPTAAISYSGTPFCKSLTTAQSVTLTGTNAYTGGSFSATPGGLSINSGTGVIVPSGSLGGVYNVAYTFPALGGCSGGQVSTTIIITNVPTASISYAGTPFCKSLTTAQPVTLTGTSAYTGGTYSATPTGLSINVNTGAIIPDTSTAGTYTITYLVPASGGCATVSTSTTVIITAVPTASISYSGTPFCKSLTTGQSVALTGTNAYVGGVFSATPAGLSINATNGAINPSASIAGTYTATYLIPASGGCAAIPVTNTVIITAVPTASISYAGTPFCKSLTTGQSVTLTGTSAYTGGIYSAEPTGLSINVNTGAIIPDTSVAGTYTVTYLVPASAGCSTVPTNTTVKITAIPTAAISYTGDPFCATLTSAQIVNLSGTNAYTGGLFSALPSGLSINSTTGAIIPSNSVAATYSVTYTIPAGGGCASTTTLTPVTIKPTPVVTASNTSVVLCSGDTTAITLNSSVAGTTFSWTAAQVNVVGIQDGTGNTIAQTLTTAGHRVGNGMYTVTPTANSCIGNPINILVKVNPLPVPELYDGVICINQNTNLVSRLYRLDTGLDASYSFVWTLDNTLLPTADAPFYDADQIGTYEVVATNISTGCVSFPVSAQVTATLAAQAMVTSGYEAFTETPMVVVTVFGSGDYLYQLDRGPVQSSNVFYDVSLGEHTVTVTDPDGCTNLIEIVNVIGYPHYFTPNDDGYHDTWNIDGLPEDHPGVIYIYDRYGKLIKQISTLGTGWDGTYNENRLPSTDYWFTIDYFEKNQMKQFRSHFSLKR
ncbi:T9SS type B sorting domain-containing protein [Flavobacterium sp.]|uniref:T9SS type B sorting domain-containing protein n=1 Tax=Flavobacterium sp. TaxID=239 RepID=UPI0026107B8D|nr:T9SS type B sorting domain-containing protein [Flavobacterium sp.]